MNPVTASMDTTKIYGDDDNDNFRAGKHPSKDKIWDIVRVVIPTAEEEIHVTTRNAPKTRRQCLGNQI